MGNTIFDIEKINKQLEIVKGSPKFEPEKYEPRFSVTQLFETGIEVTLYFVIRNGEYYYYDSKTAKQ